MAIGIALVCLPQVSMSINLHNAEIGIPTGMGTDGTERAGMFSGEGDEKPTGSHMRTHDGIDRRAIDLSIELQRRRRRNPAPFAIGLTLKQFIVELDLMRGFDDGRRPMVGPKDITRRVFVGRRQYVHPGPIGMAPGLFKA